MSSPSVRQPALRLIIPAAQSLRGLDGAALWTVRALLYLLRRGRRASRDAWIWVDAFALLLDKVQLIQRDDEPPANCCPLVPVRMLVEMDVWPEKGDAAPLEFEERQIGAQDNRRLVGKVARVVIDHIALHREAAVQYRAQAERSDAMPDAEKADEYALEVRDRGRRALRGVDLKELERAVRVEVDTQQQRDGQEGPQPRLDVRFPSEGLALVTEGGTTVEIKGPRQVWVFKTVVEAGGETVLWEDLVRADLAAAGTKLDRRRRTKRNREPDIDQGLNKDLGSTPRIVTQPKSLQRTGNRIRKALGKLAYHWHQDGRGAKWSPQVS